MSRHGAGDDRVAFQAARAILGRTSPIGTEAYAAALEAARSNGFDVARLIRTEQASSRFLTCSGAT